jgi:methylmalonyl-CoA mutase C-terminal domain/subunit
MMILRPHLWYHRAGGPHLTQQPIRVLVAKVGLDGHDRGAKIVARALRDAGMEVVYTGLHRRPEEIVAAALQEDVDVIGVSILSGAHMTLFPKIIDQMKQCGVWGDVLLVGGGVIPDEEVTELKRLGVAAIMGQDSPPDAIVELIRDLVHARGARV